MNIPKPSACPKCGASKLENIGKKEYYALGADRKKDRPTSTIYAYKCQCGHSWGVEVKALVEVTA